MIKLTPINFPCTFPHNDILSVLSTGKRGEMPMIGRMQLVLLVDWLEQGILLVTARATVVHVNRVAEILLRSGDLLRSAGGAVACHLPDETRRLRRLVREASAEVAPTVGGRLLVVHRRSLGRPLSVLVAPLLGDGAPLPGQPAAALLVSDPDRALPAAEDHLRELYGLTLAEARVAGAVLATERLQDIADRLAVSLSAIRIHLQRVFEKTGTHRQAELVRLLMAHRLPAMNGDDIAAPATPSIGDMPIHMNGALRP